MLFAVVAPRATRKPIAKGSDRTANANVEAMKRLEGPAKGIRFIKKDPIRTPRNSINDAILRCHFRFFRKENENQAYKYEQGT
jgi:hypothetical protein